MARLKMCMHGTEAHCASVLPVFSRVCLVQLYSQAFIFAGFVRNLWMSGTRAQTRISRWSAANASNTSTRPINLIVAYFAAIVNTVVAIIENEHTIRCEFRVVQFISNHLVAPVGQEVPKSNTNFHTYGT